MTRVTPIFSGRPLNYSVRANIGEDSYSKNYVVAFKLRGCTFELYFSTENGYDYTCDVSAEQVLLWYGVPCQLFMGSNRDGMFARIESKDDYNICYTVKVHAHDYPNDWVVEVEILNLDCEDD